jgi:zinc/manganese transport system substrate-binding protein
VIAASCLALLLAVRPAAQSAARVVATTEDLAALAREVGGDRIEVEAMARGYQDPHFVEPKPSFVLRLLNAVLLLVVGRDLEIGWLPPLIQQSRNARIQPGAQGYLDVSLTARIIEVPTAPVTRAMGDVHALGNPHYWLDPANGRRIAQAIASRLSELRPRDAAYFDQRLADFERRLTAAEQRWDAAMAPYNGLEIVTYHRSWSSFAQRFGLDVVGYVEPKPGIPPSPAHTRDLIQMMVQHRVSLVIVEPYFDLRTPNALARETGASVLVLPPSVGGVREATDYIRLFDYNLAALTAAIARAGGRQHHDPHDHGHDRRR